MDRLRALGRVFGEWGAPPDAAARIALVLAGLAVVAAFAPEGAWARWSAGARSSRTFVAGASFLAAALSLTYVAIYLRGGPRIVDATSYFLQGRALSEGHFAWSVPAPSASFRGRFLLAEGDRIAGIFPPGYPLLLSLGFAVGAPMVVGPALAAAIAFVTYALGRELGARAGLAAREVEGAARLATAIGVVSAALRYHTADTMAHGACALAFAIGAWSVLRATRPETQGDPQPAFFLIAGLALGYVAATRFGSAVGLGLFVAWHALRARARVAAAMAVLAGTLPGLALLAVAQSSVTGHALASTQAAYYRASDGPPGCFRWGFGPGIGCLGEHGDFVRARLAHGYDALAALGVTARRLAHHLTDVANLEPLALLPFAPLFAADPRARAAARACLPLVGAQVLAYAPFYFDGDYPGGGARFFADVLPVEHALLALGVATLAHRAGRPLARAGMLLLGASLAGFAVHAAFAHDALRDRDGGEPMVDPSVVASAPPGSIVFVDTDHGFDLAHDPAAAEHAARWEHDVKAPVVARLRNDDHDRLLEQRLGLRQAYVYRPHETTPRTLSEAARGDAPSVARLDPWTPPPTWTGSAETWRFEAENEWPPFLQTGGAWAEPVWEEATCASPSDARRALVVRADAPGSVRIEVPVPRAGTWAVTPRVLVREGGPHATLTLGDPALASWDVAPPGPGVPLGPARCIDLPAKTITTNAVALPLDIALPACPPPAGEVRAAPQTALGTAPCEVALDRTILSPR